MVVLRETLPPARDQGMRATCLSIALTDGHHACRAEPPALAADVLHFHASRRAGVGVNDAVPLSDALVALNSDGQPAEKHCRYSWKSRDDEWTPSTPSDATVWRRAAGTESNDPWAAMQRELKSGMPVVLLMEIDDAFWEPVDGVVTTPTAPIRTNHAVLAVELDNLQARVLIRNSWGELWGDDGYAWLSQPYVAARCSRIVFFGETP